MKDGNLLGGLYINNPLVCRDGVADEFSSVVGGGAKRGSMATRTAVSGPQRLHWESPIINHGGDGGGGWGACYFHKS